VKVDCLVVAENANSYIGKKGQVNQQRLALLDQDADCRFLNTFDYDLTDEERNKYTGRITGKTIRLGIQELTPINGRLKARGRILEVFGGNGEVKK